MLGKLTATTTFREDYTRVLELFVTAICVEAIDADFIPPIEQEFRRIAPVAGVDFDAVYASARAKCELEIESVSPMTAAKNDFEERGGLPIPESREDIAKAFGQTSAPTTERRKGRKAKLRSLGWEH